MTYTALDLDTMVRTLYGEARGESQMGRAAVAWVIRNRLAHPGWWSRDRGDGIPDDTIAAVCRDPWQFSCWNEGDPNREKMTGLDKDFLMYKALEDIARGVLDGKIPDPTHGATHYKVVGTKAAWDSATLGRHPVVIGKHEFYALGLTA